MALPLDVATAVERVHSDLEALEKTLEPMLSYSSLSQLNSQLSTEDMLRLNTALAYSLQSLYFICMQTYGEDLQDHPIQQELERIKDYIKQVQTALAAKQKEAPAPKVDKETATRFINSQISQQVKTEAAIATTRATKGSTPLPKASHLTWKQDLDRILGPARKS
jgi:HPt (histidine-containing phosphotransfer) domain-containing protein